MFFLLPALDPSYNDWVTGDDTGWWVCERLWDNGDQYTAQSYLNAPELHPNEISFPWVWE